MQKLLKLDETCRVHWFRAEEAWLTDANAQAYVRAVILCKAFCNMSFVVFNTDTVNAYPSLIPQGHLFQSCLDFVQVPNEAASARIVRNVQASECVPMPRVALRFSLLWSLLWSKTAEAILRKTVSQTFGL